MKTESPKRDLSLIGVFAAVLVAVNVGLVITGRLAWGGWWNWQTFGVMVAAALTLALFSQLYADNALFKAAEHIYVGTSVGYGLAMGWYSMWVGDILKSLRPLKQHGWRAFTHPLEVAARTDSPLALGIWSIVLPTILGLMIYTRLTKRWNWISRWPFALMIGFGVGWAIPTQVAGNLLKQIEPMLVSVIPHAMTWEAWNPLIVLVGVLTTLVYFFFSLEHKGAVGGVSKVGVWFLMVAFGASFGYTVMGRLSLLIGRIDFLFRDWIPLVK